MSASEPGPEARSRAQAKEWKKARKLQAQQKAAEPSVAPSASKRPPRDASPNVQLSKALAYLLRHGAEKESLAIRPDGYVRLDTLLARPRVQKIVMASGDAPTAADVQAVVQESDKQRFALVPGTAEAPGEGAYLWARAVQGHSLAAVNQLDETPLTLSNVGAYLPEHAGVFLAIHGTTAAAWDAIVASGGLSRMKRNHIHLSKGLPGADGVISGMRASSSRLVYVDVGAALEAGIPFVLSSNHVVLTPGNDEGQIPLSYVVRVDDAQGTQVWP